MSIATFAVTDEARTGIALDFLHPEYRSSSSGATRATHQERSDGDAVVHPFEWDSNVYPCPECLLDDPRVGAAIEAAQAAAHALSHPSHEWENIRLTSWKAYELFLSIWKTVEERASIYDRKDTMLHLIGSAGAKCFFNVALVWILRASRQQAVSAAVTVRRWEEAAGLIDELLQCPMGKDTQTLELSADFLRTLCCVALGAANEVALAFYRMDAQHMHGSVVDLAHCAEFYYGLADTIVSQSGSIPAVEKWQNFVTIKAEFYAGMTLFLSSLEPDTRYGDSRRRRAQECLGTALEAVEALMTSERAVVSAEVSEAITKCDKFRSWKRKGWIRECVLSPLPFRNTTGARLASWDVPPYEGIRARLVAREVLRGGEAPEKMGGASEAGDTATGSDAGEEEAATHLSSMPPQVRQDERAAAVMRGDYGVGDGLMHLNITTVPEDIRKAKSVRCLPPGEAQFSAASAIAGALRQSLSVCAPTPDADATKEVEVAVVDPPQEPPTCGTAEAPTTPSLDTIRMALQAEEDAARAAERSRKVAEADADVDNVARASGNDPLALPIDTAPFTFVKVAASIAAVPGTLLDFQLALRQRNNSTLTRCAVLFVVDLNHEEKAKADKLRNAVIASIQHARLGHSDRVGLVSFDPVDATPTVMMVQATEQNLKKLFSHILRMKGRGKFAHSHGTPLVRGIAAAAKALRALDADDGDASYAGNRHIVVLSNGEDRTEESDQLDWHMWSGGRSTDDEEDIVSDVSGSGDDGDRCEHTQVPPGGAADTKDRGWRQNSEPAIRRQLRDSNVQVHTAAVSFAADDALLQSIAQTTRGCSHRVVYDLDDDQKSALEIQKFLTNVLASAVARIASDIAVTIATPSSAPTGGDEGGEEAAGGRPRILIVSIESEQSAPPLAKMNTSPPADDNSHATAARLFTPVTSLNGAVTSAVIPLLPIAVGQASSLLITLAVPTSLVQQDIIHLADITASYRRNGAASAVVTLLTQPVVHVNTVRIEDPTLHARLRQVYVDAFTGTGHLLTTASNTMCAIRGHEVVCEGDAIRTGAAEDGASLSLITIQGTRLDLAPHTEVRLDGVSTKAIVCHVLRGKVAVSTPSDQTVTVTSDGYRCEMDAATCARISFVEEANGGARYEVKTLSGRCVAARVNSSSSSSPSSSSSVEILSSRQTTTMNQPNGQLSTPWLMELSREEVDDIIGRRPAAAAPASNCNSPSRTLSGGGLGGASSETTTTSPCAAAPDAPPALSGRLSPAVSELSVLQGSAAAPARVEGVSSSAVVSAASKTHAALHAAMVMDTHMCRLEIAALLSLLKKKYADRLRTHTAPQTGVVKRARVFIVTAELTALRNRLANSVAYMCNDNAALDSWRGAFELYAHFGTRSVDEDNTKLLWAHVHEIAQMQRAIECERPIAVALPSLFESVDLREQLAQVTRDADDRRDAAKQIRMEEQTLMRQSEENRREFALVRLFQLFQWDGFETVWVKDVLSVFNTVPRAKLFIELATKGAAILEAVGVDKSLTDEQFATALDVTCKDLTPAEFTAFIELLARRAVAVQDDIEASIESRAYFAFARALGIGTNGPLCQLDGLLSLMHRALTRRTWASTRITEATTELSLQKRWDRFVDGIASSLQRLEYEVVQTPLRRKSTAALLKKRTDDEPQVPSGDDVVMLSIMPEDDGEDCPHPSLRPVSLLTFLPAIQAFFGTSATYAEITTQLQVLTDAADAALNKSREFAAMIDHEAKLKEKAHLLDWERRHMFDGVSEQDLVRALQMDALPPQVHTSLDALVAPVCIIAGLIQAPRTVLPNVFEGFHGPGANPSPATVLAASGSHVGGGSVASIFGGAKVVSKSADEVACESAWSTLKRLIATDYAAFKERLSQFSPLSISHRVILRSAPYLEHDDVNPQMLSPISPLIASLAKWVLLFLRLSYLQHDYDNVERTVPTRLLGYVHSRALRVPSEPSPSLHIVAAAVRPTSAGSRVRSPAGSTRGTSPTSPSGQRSPTAGSRPTSATKSRVWAQVCSASSREATQSAVGLLGPARFAVDAPRAPSFVQKLSARPSTAGTLRRGFAEPGPLPAAVAPPSPTPPSYLRRAPDPAQNGAAFLPSNIAALAQREVQQSRAGGLSNTVARPQSAYVRGATQSYRLSSASPRPASNVTGHLFYGDDLNLSSYVPHSKSPNPAVAVASTPVRNPSSGTAGFRRYSPPPAPSV